ncbi:hypothetical protein [Flavobacterium suncheonense]|uniref:Uncharacterized protein n=1 Tax=Flavobacterium suncheonense GH29-5 = DSM 17707 TaxID=1121899 RepID=A0A0A2MP28_9FLAO|nr:hypothetical protein [Flavobacterium suncheonense]KGO90040.1 hypothetical protein Q764_05390 [Flavobacterium suncheonense GH29-5 = DSM 17707]
MKKTLQVQHVYSANSRMNKLLFKPQQIVFSIKSFRNFDIFHFTNPLHDELQIIYANLRV